MFRATKNNRVARWAAVAVALNALALTGSFFRQLESRKSVDLWVPAADVHPYLDPDTREVVNYKVTDVAVEEVSRWARWPKFEELYGALGLNIALFGWVIRLALVESNERARNSEHEHRGRAESPPGGSESGKE
jgi:hypothetical protein